MFPVVEQDAELADWRGLSIACSRKRVGDDKPLTQPASIMACSTNNKENEKYQQQYANTVKTT